MSWIIPTRKWYHEWKGKPSLIGDVSTPPTSGQIVPINNNGGGPFGIGSDGTPRGGGSGPLGGGGSGPLGGGSNGPLGDQNPKPYVTRLARPWIGPTRNSWYLSWYPIQPPIAPNPPPSKKSLPCPIYTVEQIPMFMYEFLQSHSSQWRKEWRWYCQSICFTLCDAIFEWGENFIRTHPVYKFEKLEATFYKRY